MKIQVNCPACQGTGGLFDAGLGIDDECDECEGCGAKMLEGREIPLSLFTEVCAIDSKVRKIGVANFILKWEEISCPCCEENLNFKESDDMRSVDIRCSEEGYCNFEILLF